MSGILATIVAILRSAFPLPNFREKEDLADWIRAISDPVADLIVDLLEQFFVNGRVTIETPDGAVEFVKQPDGTVSVSEGGVDRLVATAMRSDGGDQPKKFGDGTILKMLIELFIKFAPIIFALKPDDESVPEPPVV